MSITQEMIKIMRRIYEIITAKDLIFTHFSNNQIIHSIERAIISDVRIIYNTLSVSKNRYQRKTKVNQISQNFRVDLVVKLTRICLVFVSFSVNHSVFLTIFSLVSVSVFFIENEKMR